MKIIDLLNKIANGEEVPKKIKINNFIYEYRGFMYCTENSNFQDIEDYIFGKWNFNILNEEVEILDDEEKGLPEKIPNYSLEKIQKAKNKDEWYEERISLLEKQVEDLHIKMNELIDYLEKQSKGDD